MAGSSGSVSVLKYSRIWCHPAAWVVKTLLISLLTLMMLLVSILTLPSMRCQASNWMLLSATAASTTTSHTHLLAKDTSSSDPTLINSSLPTYTASLPPALSSQVLLQPQISSNSTSSNFTADPSNAIADSLSTPTDDTVHDASCVSKWQHLMYRNHPSAPLLNFPSVLAEDLKSYEQMHARCTLNKTWQHVFYHPHQYQDACKYLVHVEGTAGLGNRLLSLASAFVYALLTDRVLLVDPRGHLPLLLCQPFGSSSWRLPQDFPMWDLEYGSPSLGKAVEAGFNSSRLLLTLRHEQSDGDKLFYCSHILEQLDRVAWIGWNSNQYFLPRFFTLPSFWPRLRRLFPNVSLTSTYLGRYLFLPNNEVWETIVRIYSAYFTCSRKKVSVQVRLHARQDLAEFYPPAFSRMMQCLIHHRILPNVSTDHHLHQSDAVTGNHLSVKRPESRSETDVSACKLTTSVMLASLQLRYYEELKELYMNSPTDDDSFVRVHMASHDGSEQQSYDQSLKAFTEIWLLSLGDEIATSSWSTFGYVAQSLGGLRPYVMNIRGNFENEHLPPCYVGQSPDPCNHYPFMRQSCESGNQSVSSEHASWIQTHVRPCQDEGSGIQLVDDDDPST